MIGILFGFYLTCAFAIGNETNYGNLSLNEAINTLLNHAKYDLQDAGLALFLSELKGLRGANRKNPQVTTRVDGISSYTRWGRKTCPGGATLVYEGFAAGGMYTDSGTASNYLCLPKNPDFDSKIKRHPLQQFMVPNMKRIIPL